MPAPVPGSGSSARVTEIDLTERIDEQILANPRHPRWQEMREKWEKQHLAAEEEAY